MCFFVAVVVYNVYNEIIIILMSLQNVERRMCIKEQHPISLFDVGQVKMKRVLKILISLMPPRLVVGEEIKCLREI